MTRACSFPPRPPLLQLYRVNVLLQAQDSPEAALSTPPFFVLRRYSQFRALYEKVRGACACVWCGRKGGQNRRR